MWFSSISSWKDSKINSFKIYRQSRQSVCFSCILEHILSWPQLARTTHLFVGFWNLVECERQVEVLPMSVRLSIAFSMSVRKQWSVIYVRWVENPLLFTTISQMLLMSIPISQAISYKVFCLRYSRGRSAKRNQAWTLDCFLELVKVKNLLWQMKTFKLEISGTCRSNGGHFLNSWEDKFKETYVKRNKLPIFYGFQERNYGLL